jgi:hypothetical protein
MKYSTFFSLLLGVMLFSACAQTDYDRDLEIAQGILDQNRNLSATILGDMKIIHVSSKDMGQLVKGPAKLQFCGNQPQVSYFYECYDTNGNRQEGPSEQNPYTGCGTGRININGKRFDCEIGYITKTDYLSKEERDAGTQQHWLVFTVKKRNTQNITFQEIIDFGLKIDACSAEVKGENIRIFSRGVFEFPAHTPKRELADAIARIAYRKTGYISK